MPVTPSQVATQLRQRSERGQEAARQRARSILGRLGEARRILQGHGARTVVVFGSLVSERTHAGSDVDLAVEGLPSPVYFAALADVTAALRCTVDLVRLEDAPPSLRERIAAEGRVL